MTDRPDQAPLPAGAGVSATLELPMELNLAEHVCYLQRDTPGMIVRETADLLIADSGLDNDSFNFVGAARFTTASALDRIAVTIAGLEALERPFAWRVGPASTPSGLSGLLAAAGLPAIGTEPAMWRPLPGAGGADGGLSEGGPAEGSRADERPGRGRPVGGRPGRGPSRDRARHPRRRQRRRAARLGLGTRGRR